MQNIKNFIIIRHGETDLNANGFMQFQIDEPLNKKGEQQAEVAASILAKRAGSSYYMTYSPLTRARETAAIIQRSISAISTNNSNYMACTTSAFIQYPGLRERFAGRLDGAHFDDFMKLAKQKIPSNEVIWDNMHLIYSEIERSQDLVNRVRDAIKDAYKQSELSRSTLVVVSHLGALDTFMRLVLGFQNVTMLKNATPYMLEQRNDIWSISEMG